MKFATFWFSFYPLICTALLQPMYLLYDYLSQLSTTILLSDKLCSNLHLEQTHLELRHKGISPPPQIHFGSLTVIIIVYSLFMSVNLCVAIMPQNHSKKSTSGLNA
jgi:hypothetical protein